MTSIHYAQDEHGPHYLLESNIEHKIVI